MYVASVDIVAVATKVVELVNEVAEAATSAAVELFINLTISPFAKPAPVTVIVASELVAKVGEIEDTSGG